MSNFSKEDVMFFVYRLITPVGKKTIRSKVERVVTGEIYDDIFFWFSLHVQRSTDREIRGNILLYFENDKIRDNLSNLKRLEVTERILHEI